MVVVQHLNPDGMHKNPAFTQAIVVEGAARTIYIGGQNAVSPEGKIVGAGDLAAQAEQALANVETVLGAAGATIHDVIKWTLFIVQGQDLRPGFAVFQRVWGQHPNPPAITSAFVAALAHPDYLLEMEAIAVVGAGGVDVERA